MKRFLSLLTVLFVLSGCNGQGDERLTEKATIEARATAQAEIEAAYERGKKEAEAALEAEIENLSRRASEMEADLEVRHRFFQAVRGTYEGQFETENGEFMIRLTLVPSLVPYPVTRVRTLEEIASDITGLHFNAQVLQWNPSNRLSAVGCRVEGIKPDLKSGQLFISSENCPNFYAFTISDPDLLREAGGNPRSADKAVTEEVAESLADEVARGHRESIISVTGILQPTTNAAVYPFTAIRVERK